MVGITICSREVPGRKGGSESGSITTTTTIIVELPTICIKEINSALYAKLAVLFTVTYNNWLFKSLHCCHDVSDH